MAAGIRIINDWGTLLVDDTFPTLHLREKGTVTIPASGFINIGNKNGRLAVRSGNVVSIQYFSYTEPLTAGYYVIGQPGSFVEWYLFDVHSGVPSNIGLIVRNPANQIMFDAMAKPLRIDGMRSAGNRPGWMGTASYNPNRYYAVMPMAVAFDSYMTFSRIGGGDPNQFFQNEQITLAGASVNGGNVNFAMTYACTRSYGPYFGTVLPTRYEVHTDNAALAVIDVSGY